jgi:hypothetical protein
MRDTVDQTDDEALEKDEEKGAEDRVRKEEATVISGEAEVTGV